MVNKFPLTCYVLNVSPLNSYVEILNPSVSILGDRATKEIIKVKWDKGRALIPQDQCPYKR